MSVHVEGQGPLVGEVAPPGDKSLSHRLLFLAALGDRPVRLCHVGTGDDVRSSRRCLEALGVRVTDVDDGALLVEGCGGVFAPAPGTLDCGNSGTTMRLLVGILAGREVNALLIGDESLSRRPMGRVLEPLRAMGASVEGSRHGGARESAPIRVKSVRGLRPIDYRSEVASAQVKSAVLFAALLARGTTRYREPAPSRDHTERLLGALGVELVHDDDGALRLEGPAALGALPDAIHVPGDPSSSAFFAVAASMIPGSRVVIRGVSLNPTRIAFARVLERMGASVVESAPHEVLGEPVGDLVVEGVRSGLQGVVVERADIPSLIDEIPALAMAAAVAHGTTRFRGVDELRHKESDRLAAVVEGLSALGGTARVESTDHGAELVVEGGGRLSAATLSARGDHRLAMSFALAGLVAAGGVDVEGAAACSVSYPDYFATLGRLGAAITAAPDEAGP